MDGFQGSFFSAKETRRTTRSNTLGRDFEKKDRTSEAVYVQKAQDHQMKFVKSLRKSEYERKEEKCETVREVIYQSPPFHLVLSSDTQYLYAQYARM
jgi:hypothetical protein